MNEINLKVSIEEANLILEGLGSMPFNKVYTLVGKLQEQAAQQLNNDEHQAADVTQIDTKGKTVAEG